MAIETLTISLTGTSVTGSDYVSGSVDDNQIVTFTDGGSLTGTIVIAMFGKGTPTEPGAGPGGDDYFNLDLSQFNDDFAFEVKSLGSGDIFAITGYDTMAPDPVDPNILNYTYTGSDGLTHTFSINMVSINGTGTVSVVCFCTGTRIATPDGPRRVEDLAIGDLVLTLDNGAQLVRWIGQTERTWEREPHKDKPILIPTGSLGAGLPLHDLAVSPQHRILVPDADGGQLVPAKGLTGLPGIRQLRGRQTTEYFHLLLDRHEILFAEGVPAESFFAGSLSAAALPPSDRKAIRGILAESAERLGIVAQTPARPFLGASAARRALIGRSSRGRFRLGAE